MPGRLALDHVERVAERTEQFGQSNLRQLDGLDAKFRHWIALGVGRSAAMCARLTPGFPGGELITLDLKMRLIRAVIRR